MVSSHGALRGLGSSVDGGAPLILQRIDDDFVGTTLEQLRSSDPYQAVLATRADARTSDRTLRLYQPVHRTFHLLLVDAYCAQPGRPRLDPAKIESSGMVIRRVARRRAANAAPANHAPQGWLSVGKRLRGWSTLEDTERDPDPLRRPVASGGHPSLAAQALARQRLAEGAEQYTALFVAPPDVCEASGRTLLFGVIPTASAEMSESPAPSISPDDFDHPGVNPNNNLNNAIPRFLRRRNTTLSFGSLAGRTLSGTSAAGFADTAGRLITDPDDKALLTEFLNLLRFLRVSLDAFGGGPDAEALLALLSEILLPDSQEDIRRGTGRRADQALAIAASALVQQVPGGPTSFEMPLHWPVITQDLGDRIYARLKQRLAARLSAAQPGVARFDDDAAARYQVRAFMRVRRDDGCPPQLIWSEPSEPFTIVPWFESGTRAPVQIQLPDVTSENVKLLRPNVALRLPRRLFNFLNEIDPKGLLDGKASEGKDIGLDWVCGFNISIIFMLALIVMFIFLILLNIVFWWLPFIKICFPIPSFSSREES
jgi:hypothetical protein